MAVSLSDLRTRTRARADQQAGGSSGFLSNDEIDVLINDALYELYDLITAEAPDFFETTASLTLSGAATEANATGALASDFHEMIEVVKYPDTTARVTVPPAGNLSVLGYLIEGANIRIVPYELSAGAYRYRYVAGPTLLSGSGTIAVRIERWSEYITVRAALDCNDKEETLSDPNWRKVLDMRKRIVRAVAKRRGAPETVPDPDAFTAEQLSPWW